VSFVLQLEALIHSHQLLLQQSEFENQDH
jgi:hypothetical protein